MSALRFEGAAPVLDDRADMQYLSLTHGLIMLGELTPSQEANGGLRITTHGREFTTSAVELQTEKVVPVLYLGRTAMPD